MKQAMIGLTANSSAPYPYPEKPGSPTNLFTFIEVDTLEAGEDIVEFVRRTYPRLVDYSGKLNPGRQISFDFVPELTQTILLQFGDKIFFSEGRFIVPKDIPENYHGSGTFQLSAGESQTLTALLQAYGFTATAEVLYDPLGHWNYTAFSVPAVSELELVRAQYRRLSQRSG